MFEKNVLISSESQMHVTYIKNNYMFKLVQYVNTGEYKITGIKCIKILNE